MEGSLSGPRRWADPLSSTPPDSNPISEGPFVSPPESPSSPRGQERGDFKQRDRLWSSWVAVASFQEGGEGGSCYPGLGRSDHASEKQASLLCGRDSVIAPCTVGARLLCLLSPVLRRRKPFVWGLFFTPRQVLAAAQRTLTPTTWAEWNPAQDNKQSPPRSVRSEPKEGSETGSL